MHRLPGLFQPFFIPAPVFKSAAAEDGGRGRSEPKKKLDGREIVMENQGQDSNGQSAPHEKSSRDQGSGRTAKL